MSHDDTFGDYTCIAKNKMGTRSKVVTLSEGAKPGIPYIEIKHISPDAADVMIEVKHIIIIVISLRQIIVGLLAFWAS